MWAVVAKQWIVMPFRRLADPEAVLGATDNATVLVLKASEGLLGEAVLTDLAQLCLGNPMMEILDENVRRRKSTEYTDHSPLN